ncbi:MAG TPA: TIGR03560 family F420-dependent LLM class oxidoreductase [Candidatus Dormibacteraeota bacterium]|nr:TIGR03560 family F420-dependent LLM class oxidoreductase [Candidatus Dormibacteraeota bacterium]
MRRLDVGHELRFGLCTDQNLSWERTLERWLLYEELGFDSVWLCDHLIQPSRPDGPYLEAWTLLAALAARTHRIRIGVLVSSNTFRHPALLAREAVTVDHVSGGRLELGLGAGWYQPEHTAFGIDFPAPGERVARFREAVEVVDRLLREEVTTYEGRHYRLRQAPTRPAPVQRPRPPLTLGAHGPRMLRIVARYADRWNSHGTVEEIKLRNATLDRACREVGRDPERIVRSLYYWVPRSQEDPWSSAEAFVQVIDRYREAGITDFILDHPRDDQLDVLEQVATEVIPRLRLA